MPKNGFCTNTHAQHKEQRESPMATALAPDLEALAQLPDLTQGQGEENTSRPALVLQEEPQPGTPGVNQRGSEQRSELLPPRSSESSATPNTVQPHIKKTHFQPRNILELLGAPQVGAQHSQRLFVELQRFTHHI